MLIIVVLVSYSETTVIKPWFEYRYERNYGGEEEECFHAKKADFYIYQRFYFQFINMWKTLTIVKFSWRESVAGRSHLIVPTDFFFLGSRNLWCDESEHKFSAEGPFPFEFPHPVSGPNLKFCDVFGLKWA